ncbi:MAG: uridine kinase [Bacteroidota bacterium]
MSNSRKPYIVGITGGSATGKTKFLYELGALFSQNEVCILSQDNYYKSNDYHTKDENGHINYDLPTCIDLDAFHADIQKLCNNEVVKRREYRFQHETQQGEWLEFYPAPVIIIEGLFIFYKEEIFNSFDLKIFIEANENIQLERRLKRDTVERNISADYVLYQWENHVKPAFELYLLPYKEKADMIINNNSHFNNSLKVVEDHFRCILKNKSNTR